MGLDMYLISNSRKLCFTTRNPLEGVSKSLAQNGVVAYWRKANAIHNWFVKHVQDGCDDCGYYIVTMQDLKDLDSDIDDVLASSRLVMGKVSDGIVVAGKERFDLRQRDGLVIEDTTVAEKLLPTKNGFFFGGTDYDSGYVQDLTYTKRVIEHIRDNVVVRDDAAHVIDEPDWNLKLFYHSSW